MQNGLRCPECGSFYSSDPSMLNSGMSAGDVCGNESMNGKNPKNCSPNHPCRGILELIDDSIDVVSGKRSRSGR